MMKIKKGDEVLVLAGKDKGKRGKVLSIVDNQKALVDNINVVKKHVRANPQTGSSGGVVDKEMPIHLSNLSLYNSVSDKGGRVGFRVLEDGRKVRYFLSTGDVLDLK